MSIRRRFTLTVAIVASLGVLVSHTESQTRFTYFRDAWFTTTELVAGSDYRNAPERLYNRTEVFARDTDKSVILVVVFNDGGSHEMSGVRHDPEGRSYQFKQSINLLYASPGGWRAITRRWTTASLKPGRHSVELVIDEVPAGRYTFEVR